MPISRVWALDASALIQLKRIIRVASQWSFFPCLEAMVDAGTVVFPKKVMEELGRGNHPDMPGAWAHGCGERVKFAFNPHEETLVRVMAIAHDVVDPSDADSDADPYVIAQALEVRDLGYDVMVVTRDATDRPDRISIVTACARPGIDLPTCNEREFIAQIDCDAGTLKMPR